MRELVLNHASVCAPSANRECVTRWLKDLVDGMAQLTQERVVKGNLRMACEYHEIPCLPDYSLFDACQELRANSHRDRYQFVMKLAAKVPLLTDMPEEISDRFRACEERELASPDGEPLVFCAITDGVAVGFPSAPEWDRDCVTVHFNELLPDESIEPVSETIDQLTRAEHAGSICVRHQERLRADINARTFWGNRHTAFPHLQFGPGVERDIQKCAHLFPTIACKLAALNESVGEWRELGNSMPNWKTKVTPENAEALRNSVFRASRTFPSRLGAQELFHWHARFGSNGRIHLRLDAQYREVEIGYIGQHLPL